MEKIQGVSHIVCSMDKSDTFFNSVNESIEQMQSEGYEVEIQYQQSDKAFSVILIARSNI